MSYVPAVGDTGVIGTVIEAYKTGGGRIQAGDAGAEYSGPAGQFSNPLIFTFMGSYLVPTEGSAGEFTVVTVTFAEGARVSFDVCMGNFAPYAQNVQAA
jgi:hypothetical protein